MLILLPPSQQRTSRLDRSLATSPRIKSGSPQPQRSRHFHIHCAAWRCICATWCRFGFVSNPAIAGCKGDSQPTSTDASPPRRAPPPPRHPACHTRAQHPRQTGREFRGAEPCVCVERAALDLRVGICHLSQQVAVLYRRLPDPEAAGRYVTFHYCS